jgi:DNA-binding response OmpR family regulator
MSASRHIAIVEDDPEIGPMLSKLLRMEGFEATVINDGRLAAGALSSGRYAAAVLDVMLPGKDGISILRDLRSVDATKRLPVVMLSARTDDATTWEGWREGASYFMAKPFDPEELIRVLRSAMG